MAMVELELKVLASIAVVGLMAVLVRLYDTLVFKPRRLRSMLTKQGISGPPPTFLLGNIMEIKKARDPTVTGTGHLAPTGESPVEHNCASVLFPFLEQWRKQYGEVFTFAVGKMQILYVNQAEMVREITTCTSLDFGKPLYQFKEHGPLLGQGILTSNGNFWAYQRKIIAPEFYMDKVKGMTKLITESAMTLVNTWKTRIETSEGGRGSSVDIKVDDDIRSFSGDVISRACFGSNFSKGKQIFHKLRTLQKLMFKKVFFTRILGTKHIPTKSNREVWALEKEVATLIRKVVKEREESGYEKDLLQMVLEGAHKDTATATTSTDQEAIDRFIVDNCKNIYLAGYETTAVSATWCLMLLAANQHWQDRVRAEVLQLCQGQIPHTNMLNSMKQLTMVIYESLRLYPPVTVMSREAFKDMKFGDINVPKGLIVWTMAVTLHTDPETWGSDAYKFKPDRFENGITGACKLPYMYMPFGVGPRVCLGQNLAMVELKILLALILSNFSFRLSPNYRHAPALRTVVEPEHGVDLLVTKL